MQHTQQEFIGSAIKHARRARRTTDRIAVFALGFGVAYYFDTEKGRARREQLRRSLLRTAATVDAVMTSDVIDAPPVFHPLLGGQAAEERVPRETPHFKVS
jgi:hypothetical protein